ncbi:hypothetical protein CTEN210_11766 [Chaetoceros tenuissimus]|uniref:J domain-containing protein n=1 Tax=Chaetoceros tenuissimus TaxID=426638 RepID=A0AAD3D234_9STRA|nr:hypothetical protein CTEN210_11766 [Chaetoceros tenuissimus]
MLEIGREKIRRLCTVTSTRTCSSFTFSTTPASTPCLNKKSLLVSTPSTAFPTDSITRSSLKRSFHLIAKKPSVGPNDYNNMYPLESRLDRYFSTREKATRTQINSALRRLSLKQGFSMLELRDAYFEAAKRCHPDANQDDDEVKARSSDLFLKVTEAYELLRKYPRGDLSNSSEIDEDEYYEKNIISKTEEQFYRDAVYETLGMRAEDLEESKKCAMFRIWLAGGSHTAFHFNLFLMRHGGLAPMLGKKKITALIGEGKRRRRKR